MMRSMMLITDLDGTLLGHAAALDLFRTWLDENRAAITLVYATGRTVTDVHGLVRLSELPAPDHVIGAVGTEVVDFGSGATHVEWSQRMDCNWNSVIVRQEMQRFVELELQPDRFQSERKVSYYLDDATPEQLSDLSRALSAAAIPADLLYSGHRYVDVLPRGMNKGTAAVYLANRLGFERSDVIACGDSGNDLSMFLQEFQTVLVANAEEAVVRLAAEPFYQSRFSHAAGVLDGIRHWMHQRHPTNGMALSFPEFDRLDQLTGAR